MEVDLINLREIDTVFAAQIFSYALSESLEVDFVLEIIEQLIEHHAIPKKQKTLIHSDQGVHYTSMQFQSLLNDKELRQSMSRRGNCWDNAPQESFFGHMKDDLGNLGYILTFSDLSIKIDDYMGYYNNEWYQWNLAKLSLNQYAAFLKTGVYPLAHLVKTPDLPVVVPL
ncbi:IS3 family transposase [Virgibacillus oceani]